MALKIGEALAIALCDLAVDAIDTGGGVGKLNIYSGTQPANPGASVGAAVLLVSFDLPEPCFGAAATSGDGAVATANAIAALNAVATGTATWARVLNGAGTPIFDGTVTVTAGAGDIKMSSTSVVSGVEASVVSWTFKQPKGWT